MRFLSGETDEDHQALSLPRLARGRHTRGGKRHDWDHRLSAETAAAVWEPSHRCALQVFTHTFKHFISMVKCFYNICKCSCAAVLVQGEQVHLLHWAISWSGSRQRACWTCSKLWRVYACRGHIWSKLWWVSAEKIMQFMKKIAVVNAMLLHPRCYTEMQICLWGCDWLLVPIALPWLREF